MPVDRCSRYFFGFALITLIFSTLPLLKQYLPSSGGEMSCSTKAIMHFEDTVTESVNASVHFTFTANDTGSLIVEGYSDSKAGWLYLQRYVKFDYHSERVSEFERYYKITNLQDKKSSIDESPDVIFDYFMREMFDSHDDMLIKVRKLNPQTILISSLSSPLFICNLN